MSVLTKLWRPVARILGEFQRLELRAQKNLLTGQNSVMVSGPDGLPMLREVGLEERDGLLVRIENDLRTLDRT